MSEQETNHEKHEALANRFGTTTDPLAQYSDTFWASERRDDVDPFQLWLEDRVYTRDYSKDYVTALERRVDQWRSFMVSRSDRHPACPSARHVESFARYYLNERDNNPGTVAEKLGCLSRCYRYFQESPNFPHGTDFNPFDAAKGKMNLNDDDPKPPRPIPIHELRTVMQDDLRHVRDRAIIMAGFKWGLRASEVTNVKLEDVHLANAELREHYDDLGSAPALEDRPNAVYVPHDRERNKRDRPTVLPIDDEFRRVLTQWLLCRPDNGEEWLFTSKNNGLKIDHTNINDIWKKHFRPRYGPTDRFRGVTSHYGRHYFVTYMRNEKDWPRQLLKYMRGDRQSGGEIKSTRDAIDSYIHTFYEDIEARYRREIYKFRV